MKSTFLMIQSIALLLALSGESEISKSQEWTCYSLTFGSGVDTPWEGLPAIDEPVMFGRLAIPKGKLPVDAWNVIEGKMRLEPVDDDGVFDLWSGINPVRIHTICEEEWLMVELSWIATHHWFTLSQYEGTYHSPEFSGSWADQRGWFNVKTGNFTAELVPAYSLANCMSMKPPGDR